jgi:FkbM family methyltransferase
MNGVIEIDLKLPQKELIHLRGEIDYYGASYVLSDYCKLDLTNKPLSHVAWVHGWIPDFWNHTDPRLITCQSLRDPNQLILTSKKSVEDYLRSCGYNNVYAIGLPVVYLKKTKIERIKGSLLVMPAHSLDYTTHNHWKFEQYVRDIEEISKYFKYTYICVHPSCLKKGYWVKEFQAKGFRVIEGISIDDKNALYRLQTILSTFEYVTTNSFGSHIAYAAYFGAKVSLYGSYAELKAEDFSDAPFYLENPDLLSASLELYSENRVRKELKDFFVPPQEAISREDWGRYEVGYADKQSASSLRKISGYDYSSILVNEMKKYISPLIPESIKHNYRLKKYPHYKKHCEKQQEIQRIQKIPRFIAGDTNLFDKPLKFVDSASFCFIYGEIFEKEIYKFNTHNPQPYIIDAGANIGLSIIYFKKLYPTAKIVAFEPDDKVFEILQHNIASFQLADVELVKKALRNEETTLQFYSEGADGGRIANEQDKSQIIEIPTCRLRDYLKRKVDLLKIDIEGAETKVLEDCQDLLRNVERIFVEYHSFKTQEQTLHKILAILQENSFRYQVQHIGVFSPNPFVKIHDYNKMDLQLNIFAYRI